LFGFGRTCSTQPQHVDPCWDLGRMGLIWGQTSPWS
jgi:hypothetical protein